MNYVDFEILGTDYELYSNGKSGYYKAQTADILDYVKRTGNIDLYMPANEYTTYVRMLLFNAIKVNSGRTEDKFPYFEFFGIKIHMIPQDIVDKFKSIK